MIMTIKGHSKIKRSSCDTVVVRSNLKNNPPNTYDHLSAKHSF